MEVLTSRLGISQYLSQLFARPCRIGYIGDSVIAQRDGFRPRLHEWLCKYSGQDHIATNACLGSNGSICSAFVMDELVVKHRPTLCFIECSVADMAPYTPPDEVGPVMEGIIRKLGDINCPVVFLHMYRNDPESIASSQVIRDHEAVAEHYGVPTINVGEAIKAVIANGEYTESQLFRDGIHTSELGAELSAKIIAQSLSNLLQPNSNLELDADGFQEQVNKAGYRYARNFHFTSIVPCSSEMVSDSKKLQNGTFRFVYPLLELSAPNSLSYRVEGGEVVGILAVLDKNSGFIEVSSDGIVDTTYQLWDHWCERERIKAVIFNRYISNSQLVNINVLERDVEYGDAAWMRGATTIQKSLRIIGFLLRNPPGTK